MKAYFLWLAKVVTLIILLGFFLPLLIGTALVGLGTAVTQKNTLLAARNNVAVIEVNDIIEDSQDIVEQLYEEAQNDRVTGIILRIDSPGGLVGPSQDIYSTVSKVKSLKPVVVSMGSLAASGGLYAALSATKVYAQPGTLTGSIGVIMQAPNFTRIADQIGFDMVTVKSGKLKDIGNSFRPMTDEDRSFLEALLAATHNDFIQAVADGRKLERETVEQFADGRILTGQQAKQLGLVDEIGDVYDAARAVFELAGAPLPAGEIPNLIYHEEPFSEVRKMLRTAATFLNGVKGHARISYIAY